MGVALSLVAQGALAASSALDDFNGDGYADLAIASPGEDVGTQQYAGAVNVLYGSAAGLSAAGNQFWDRESGDLLGGSGYLHFGLALVAGDFNGDGLADLAVGTPYDYVGPADWAGSVNVLYGTPAGLSATGNQYWTQDSPGVPGTAEQEDYFGYALAEGDFNGDGYADLAVGAPSDNPAGAVNVLHGSAEGLSADGSQYWDQDSRAGGDVLDASEAGDGFGDALAAGDFNGDGRADLTVGVSGEDVGDIEDAGAVNILYGTHRGLSARRNQFWHQDSAGMLDDAEPGVELFGFHLAAGDFNGDRRDELAVSVVGENVGGFARAGAVSVLYGTFRGLSARRNQLWHQDSEGIAETAEEFDLFGSAVAAGDLNGDRRSDLAVGAWGERIGTLDARLAGAVNVLYGGAGGLSASGNQLWHQESVAVLEDEQYDYFGRSVTAADFNGDESDDLAVGAPGEDVSTVSTNVDDAGQVNVFYGTTAGGLSTSGNQVWNQDSEDVLDAAEPGDEFGEVLAR